MIMQVILCTNFAQRFMVLSLQIAVEVMLSMFYQMRKCTITNCIAVAHRCQSVFIITYTVYAVSSEKPYTSVFILRNSLFAFTSIIILYNYAGSVQQNLIYTVSLILYIMNNNQYDLLIIIHITVFQQTTDMHTSMFILTELSHSTSTCAYTQCHQYRKWTSSQN